MAWVGDTLVSAHVDGALRSWRGGKRASSRWMVHDGEVTDMVVLSGGALIATGGVDGTVRLTDGKKGSPRGSAELGGPVHQLSETSDGLLALVHLDGGAPVVIRLDGSGQERGRWQPDGPARLLGGRVLVFRDGRTRIHGPDGTPDGTLHGAGWKPGPAAASGDALFVAQADDVGFGIFTPAPSDASQR